MRFRVVTALATIAMIAASAACGSSGADPTSGASVATPGTPLPSPTDTPTASPSASATPMSVPSATASPSAPTAVSSQAPGTPTGVPAATLTPTSSPVPTTVPTRVSQEPQPLSEVAFERIYPWFTPSRPTHMAAVPDESERVFVSEQEGRILSISGDPESPNGTAVTVLDIRDRVSTSGSEEGLLGFALHPDFASNGRLFVYYSAASPRRSVISEFAIEQGGAGDSSSERIVMQLSQPQWNHNGGMLIFGPDGYLYISLGDGGGSGDPNGNGQNVGTILGSVLRIDVNTPGVAYGIPEDNPFADRQPVNGVVPAAEVWAYGLRNPWKLAFDTVTGNMWAGDVGQNRVEEVDLIVKGGNYGWNLKEGPDCYQPSSGCEAQAKGPLIEPIISYTHSFGCSVTGGYVYRGSRMPSLYGAYIYADYCSGNVWALRNDGNEVTEQMLIADTSHRIPSFGLMPDGEVHMLTLSSGIQRFTLP